MTPAGTFDELDVQNEWDENKKKQKKCYKLQQGTTTVVQSLILVKSDIIIIIIIIVIIIPFIVIIITESPKKQKEETTHRCVSSACGCRRRMHVEDRLNGSISVAQPSSYTRRLVNIRYSTEDNLLLPTRKTTRTFHGGYIPACGLLSRENRTKIAKSGSDEWIRSFRRGWESFPSFPSFSSLPGYQGI